MIRYIFLSLAYLVLPCSAQNGSDSTKQESAKRGIMNSADARQLDIANHFATPNLPSVQTKISVYSNTTQSKFYVVPFLLPDWVAFSKALNARRKSVQDAKRVNEAGDQMISLPLTIYFSSPAIRKELVEAINATVNRRSESASKAQSISDSDVSVVPYSFFEIVAKVAGLEQHLFISKDLQDIEKGLGWVSDTSIHEKVDVKIRGTLSSLEQFYEDRSDESLLRGKLYSKGYALEASVVSVRARKLLQRQGDINIFGDETFKVSREIASSSMGGGLSINLGAIKFGKLRGKSGTTSTVSRQRYVSRDFVNHVVRRNSVHLEINQTGGGLDTAVSELVAFILSSCKEADLNFRLDVQNNLELGNEVIGYCTLSKEEAAQLSKIKPSLSLDDKDKKSMSKGPQKAETNSEMKYAYSNGIEWEHKGNSWVPTRLKLYVLDEAKLSMVVNLSWTRSIKKKKPQAFVYYFNYPAAQLFESTMKFDSLLARNVAMQKELATLKAEVVRLGKVGVAYEMEARHNGKSGSKNGGWTTYLKDGLTPDRIRVWLKFPPKK